MNFVDPFGLCENPSMASIYANRLTNLGIAAGGLLGGSLATLGQWSLGGLGNLATGAGNFANGLSPGSGDGLISGGNWATETAGSVAGAADDMFNIAGQAASDAWNDETGVLDSAGLNWE